MENLLKFLHNFCIIEIIFKRFVANFKYSAHVLNVFFHTMKGITFYFLHVNWKFKRKHITKMK